MESNTGSVLVKIHGTAPKRLKAVRVSWNLTGQRTDGSEAMILMAGPATGYFGKLTCVVPVEFLGVCALLQAASGLVFARVVALTGPTSRATLRPEQLRSARPRPR